LLTQRAERLKGAAGDPQSAEDDAAAAPEAAARPETPEWERQALEAGARPRTPDDEEEYEMAMRRYMCRLRLQARIRGYLERKRMREREAKKSGGRRSAVPDWGGPKWALESERATTPLEPLDAEQVPSSLRLATAQGAALMNPVLPRAGGALPPPSIARPHYHPISPRRGSPRPLGLSTSTSLPLLGPPGTPFAASFNHALGGSRLSTALPHRDVIGAPPLHAAATLPLTLPQTLPLPAPPRVARRGKVALGSSASFASGGELHLGASFEVLPSIESGGVASTAIRGGGQAAGRALSRNDSRRKSYIDSMGLVHEISSDAHPPPTREDLKIANPWLSDKPPPVRKNPSATNTPVSTPVRIRPAVK